MKVTLILMGKPKNVDLVIDNVSAVHFDCVEPDFIIYHQDSSTIAIHNVARVEYDTDDARVWVLDWSATGNESRELLWEKAYD